MKKIDQTWYLELSKPFIEKYDLRHLLNHDPFYTIWDNESTEAYELPIDRFTFNLYCDETYIEKFIKRFEQFLEQFKIENQIDELLFLSLSFKFESQQKEEYNIWQKHLRDRAKLLYKLISVNPFKITYDEARKLLIDCGEHENDIDEILVDYLYITSKEIQSNLIDRSALSITSVSKEIQEKAMQKIGERYSIEVATSDRKLYLAGNITSSVELKIGREKFTLPLRHLRPTIEQIAKSLYEEQKNHNTPFYKLLVNFDFVNQIGIEQLEKSTKFHGLSSFHAFLLDRQRSLLLRYLEENNVLSGLGKDIRNRRSDDFIYEYFLFFNLLKPKLKCLKDLAELNRRLVSFYESKKKGPRFASAYFNNAFKNISNKDEKIEKKRRIQFV